MDGDSDMMMNKGPKTLKSIRGLSIAMTGACWIKREALARLIRKQGGTHTRNYSVNITTNILVRGTSEAWKHKTHGCKEARAAELIRKGYSLVVVPDNEFRMLIEKGKPARIADTVAGQPMEWLIPPPEAIFNSICRVSGALDREYTTQGRLEQGYLRKQLFSDGSYSKCAICGREFPIELLIAAHIKPRSECTIAEKRDASNIVFPLCLFGCDSLYERGIVSINTKGYVTVANSFEPTKYVKHYLRDIKGKRCAYWTSNNADYFEWHFHRRFQE